MVNCDARVDYRLPFVFKIVKMQSALLAVLCISAALGVSRLNVESPDSLLTRTAANIDPPTGVSKPVKEYEVNLDAPAAERWKEIGIEYADRIQTVVNYIKAELPAEAFEVIQFVLRDVDSTLLDTQQQRLDTLYASHLPPLHPS